MRNLVGLPLAQLRAVLAAAALPPSLALNLYKAVHVQGITSLRDFDAVSDGRRAQLAQHLRIDPGFVASKSHSQVDGSVKMLVVPADGVVPVECVLIPQVSKHGTTRATLCVSSQAGCSLSCTFCSTGTQKLAGQVTAAGIVGQYLLARQVLAAEANAMTAAAPSATAAGADARAPPAPPSPLQQAAADAAAAAAAAVVSAPSASITNVVFMGQGEPLYNWGHVSAAVRVLTDHSLGCLVAPSRVTISTSGVAPAMHRVADLGVSLAVSLHAPTDELRSRIMAINRTYPLAQVMAGCKAYADKRTSRRHKRVCWQYTLLKGVNDHPAVHVPQLVDLAARHGLLVQVNVIPFNPWPGAPYEATTDEAAEAFALALNHAGLFASVRWSRGRDIDAACGQLKTTAAQAAAAAAAAAGGGGGGGGVTQRTGSSSGSHASMTSLEAASDEEDGAADDNMSAANAAALAMAATSVLRTAAAMVPRSPPARVVVAGGACGGAGCSSTVS